MSRPLSVQLAVAAGGVALMTVAGLYLRSASIQPLPPAPAPSVPTTPVVGRATLADCEKEGARRYGDAFVRDSLVEPQPRPHEVLALPRAALPRFSAPAFALLVGPLGRVEGVYHLLVAPTTATTEGWDASADSQLKQWRFEPGRATPTSAPLSRCVVVHPEIRWTD